MGFFIKKQFYIFLTKSYTVEKRQTVDFLGMLIILITLLIQCLHYIWVLFQLFLSLMFLLYIVLKFNLCEMELS